MNEISVFRPGDVSYLRIAAPDPARSAAFYSAVFGWKVRPDADAFQDGTGHVIGHFMTDLPVAGEAGVVPYIYVEDIDEALARVTDAGGQVTTKPYPEGDLWVAMTRDPAGNAIGVWQHGPRSLLYSVRSRTILLFLGRRPSPAASCSCRAAVLLRPAQGGGRR